MSIRLMSKIFESDLPTSEKFVLLAMADYASDTGESIYPSVATLARKTSLTDRAVQRCIQKLIMDGYLELMKNGGGRITNNYKIEVTKFEGYTRVTPAVNVVHPSGVLESPESSLNINEPKEEPEYVKCDDDGIEVKEKYVKRSEVGRIADALSLVTGMSFAINRGYLFKTAGELVKDERVSPELITSTYLPGGVWWEQDWRGKRGSKPNLQDIKETIGTFQVVNNNVIKGGLKDRLVKERGGIKK